MSGMESKSLVSSVAATFAEDMSGTNMNMLPAWIAPNVVAYIDTMRDSRQGKYGEQTIKPTKNSKVVASWLATRIAPYQNDKAIAKKTID